MSIVLEIKVTAVLRIGTLVKEHNACLQKTSFNAVFFQFIVGVWKTHNKPTDIITLCPTAINVLFATQSYADGH